MMPIDPQQWTESEIQRHTLDLRQFIEYRESTLPNGMRIIDARSASGLSFTLLPDRGLDIWSAHYKGIPLTWLSPGSPHPPDYGQAWLQQFNGGLLTTCGLAHVGPPEVDEATGARRDLHGNYTRLRAQDVYVDTKLSGHWITEDHDTHRRYELELNATIYESSLFGYQYKVQRKYWLSMHQPDIGIRDVVTNIGDQPAPLMLLYHINVGYPLVQAGAQLVTPHERVYPRDAAARAGFDTWSRYEAALPGYAEQVFFHKLMTSRQENAHVQVLLTNAQEDFGFKVTWDPATLPYLTQWKNTRQGIYVSGIEPGNCIPEGQNAARKNNRLQLLQPGESVETYVAMDVLDGSDSVKAHKDGILSTQRDGQPIAACHLDDYGS
ncbi:MAG: aldose 1-epimerase family protein [Anaerolineae bacterium]|nr:aldose 1-epimerase family protein [Anaerolineae bacterium]